MNGVKKVFIFCLISITILINCPSKVIASQMETDVGIEFTGNDQVIRQPVTSNSRERTKLPQTGQAQDFSLFISGILLATSGYYLYWLRKERSS